MNGRTSGEPLAYGIDFGTTNSSIAVAYRDRIEIVPVEAAGLHDVLPSLIYLHRDRNQAAGQDAIEQFVINGSARTICSQCELVHTIGGKRDSNCRQFKRGGRCNDARLIAGIKSDLSDTDFDSTHSWATDFTIPDLVAVVIRRLKRAADQATGANVRRVVIGHPVVFAGAESRHHERQELAETRLREAAEQAGFEEIVLLDEPEAALRAEKLPKGIALAADFGGGTFDVAVIRFDPDGGEVIGLAGAEVGGEMFDRLLFQDKVASVLHLNDAFPTSGGYRELPNLFRKRMSTLSGLKDLLNDKYTASTLSNLMAADPGKRLATVEEIIYGGHAYGFYRAIEQAKIDLSETASAAIEFHRAGIDISIPVRREEFEHLIARHLQAVHDAILGALDMAEVSPEAVSLVLRTGGSSSIPAFVRILEETFDPSVIRERPVYTTVVHGLARHALEWW